MTIDNILLLNCMSFLIDYSIVNNTVRDLLFRMSIIMIIASIETTSI